MGTEECDFLAIDIKNLVVAAIHCKVFSERNQYSVGASPCHDVSSQLVKNLDLFVRDSSSNILNIDRWNSDWTAKGYDLKKIKRMRIKPSNFNNEELRSEIENILLNPNVRKEAWIVLGNGFPIEYLKKCCSTDIKPDFHTIQLFYLLSNMNSCVQSVGAKLRIFSINKKPSIKKQAA